MLFQKQLFRHDPEGAGTIGDCYRTALACLLNMKPEEVPHFAKTTWGRDDFEPGEFSRLVDVWLNEQGFARVRIVLNDTGGVKPILEYMAWTNPKLYYLLSGESKNGSNHVVIGLGGEIVFDPALDESGIVGPMDHGYFEVELIVQIAHTSIEAPV